jgi:hypothetical protein
MTYEFGRQDGFSVTAGLHPTRFTKRSAIRRPSDGNATHWYMSVRNGKQKLSFGYSSLIVPSVIFNKIWTLLRHVLMGSAMGHGMEFLRRSKLFDFVSLLRASRRAVPRIFGAFNRRRPTRENFLHLSPHIRFSPPIHPQKTPIPLFIRPHPIHPLSDK